VKLVDLNVLLYAVNRDSAHHQAARRWLEQVLSGEETVAVPWVVVLGFLRIVTSARVFPQAMRPAEALEIVDGWLQRPNVVPLNPGDGHWSMLRGLIEQVGTAASLTTDAHLAALAIESGAELCSTDADFGRFPGLRWVNPIQVG
jgi:toxin-antitoxin system PIN domain toxin